MLERELPKCPTFVRLKNLTLGAFCMGCVFDSICSFLNHCPKLEMLTLLHTKDTCEVHLFFLLQIIYSGSLH